MQPAESPVSLARSWACRMCRTDHSSDYLHSALQTNWRRSGAPSRNRFSSATGSRRYSGNQSTFSYFRRASSRSVRPRGGRI